MANRAIAVPTDAAAPMHKTLAFLAGSLIAVASHAVESPVARDASRIEAGSSLPRAVGLASVKGEKEIVRNKASVSPGVAVTKDPYATPLFLNAKPLH